MSNTEQPKALELADELIEMDRLFSHPGLCGEAASELRRLHAETERLRAALEQEPWTPDDTAYRPGGVPQDEQDPVAWVGVGSVTWDRRQAEKIEKLTREAQPEYGFVIPLYTHPQTPRQPLIPLTDEEVVDMYCRVGNWKEWAIEGLTYAMPFARAIERAHGIGQPKI